MPVPYAGQMYGDSVGFGWIKQTPRIGQSRSEALLSGGNDYIAA